MDWLPLERLSEQIHMVISTLPDELSPPDKRPFRCLSQLERRLVGNEGLRLVREQVSHQLLIQSAHCSLAPRVALQRCPDSAYF